MLFIRTELFPFHKILKYVLRNYLSFSKYISLQIGRKNFSNFEKFGQLSVSYYLRPHSAHLLSSETKATSII